MATSEQVYLDDSTMATPVTMSSAKEQSAKIGQESLKTLPLRAKLYDGFLLCESSIDYLTDVDITDITIRIDATREDDGLPYESPVTSFTNAEGSVGLGIRQISRFVKYKYRETGETGRYQYAGTIPNFDLLQDLVENGTTRYVFRAVSSRSAGQVIGDDNGNYEFHSHAFKARGVSSDFAQFEVNEIERELATHVQGQTSCHGERFHSHWISTTGSFPLALSKAVEAWENEAPNAKIYVIDTHSILHPVIMLPMSGALKAYSVCLTGPEWRRKMVDDKTELIFWDKLVVCNASEINVRDILPPLFRSQGLHSGLMKVLPRLFRITGGAARGPKITRQKNRQNFYSSSSVSKHRKVWHLCEELTENHGTCFGLKTLPARGKDLRAQISEQQFDDFVCLVRHVRPELQLVVLTGLLSLATKDFCETSMVSAVVRNCSHIVKHCLHSVVCSGALCNIESLLWCQPIRTYQDHMEIVTHMELLEYCLLTWSKQSQSGAANEHPYGLRMVFGNRGPLRNFVHLKQLDLEGRCYTKANLQRNDLNMLKGWHLAFPHQSTFSWYQSENQEDEKHEHDTTCSATTVS